MKNKITYLKYCLLIGGLAITLTGCQLLPKQETSTNAPFYAPTGTPTPQASQAGGQATPSAIEVSDDDSLETIEAELDEIIVNDPSNQLDSLDQDINQL